MNTKIRFYSSTILVSSNSIQMRPCFQSRMSCRCTKQWAHEQKNLQITILSLLSFNCHLSLALYHAVWTMRNPFCMRVSYGSADFFFINYCHFSFKDSDFPFYSSPWVYWTLEVVQLWSYKEKEKCKLLFI